MAESSSTAGESPDISEADISQYPSHVESFETYYYLGEGRTLRETAIQRFPYLVPDCPVDSTDYPKKFESFYTKIKRWATREGWKEWVKRKEITERQAREEDMRDRIIRSQKNLVYYRGMLQQGLSAFGRKVSASTRLINQIIKLEEEYSVATNDRIKEDLVMQMQRLKTEVEAKGVEIKNFKEAKEIIELDQALGKHLDQLPEIQTPDRMRLDELDAKKIDDVMEFFRRHSKEPGELAEANK